MTATIMVRCDGTPADRPTIPLGKCRAAFPSRETLAGLATVEAVANGWSTDGKRDLCPSCTRARGK